MAEAATKLPVKSEKGAMPAPAGNWITPFENLRREMDRLFDDFHPFDWRLPSPRSMLGLEMPKLRALGWAVAPAMDLKGQGIRDHGRTARHRREGRRDQAVEPNADDQGREA